MTKEELKDKYSAFIAEISEIMGLGKPIDILKLCATTDLFFRPLENRITDLEKENAELKEIIENDVDKKIYVQLAKKAKLADVQKEQLTKAKEIIRDLLSWEERADYDYNEYNDIKRKAESILKEE